MKKKLKKKLKLIFPKLYRLLFLINFERNVLPIEFIKQLNSLSKDHIVIDLGANVGNVSYVMAKKGVRVISFEPSIKAFTELKKVSKRFKNIETYNVAAGTSNGIVKLYLHSDTNKSNENLTQSSSLLINKPNVSKDIYEEIKQIDFAEFLKSLKSPVEIIKIDIEGFEIELINHLIDEKVLENVNKIYVETHERKFTELLSKTEQLKSRIKNEGLENKFFFEWH